LIRAKGSTAKTCPQLKAYRDRAKRQHDVTGVTVSSQGQMAKLGDRFVAKVTPSGVELHLRTESGKYVLQDRTQEVASCIAAEGEWLVAYIPSRQAIYRYRLSKRSGKPWPLLRPLRRL